MKKLFKISLHVIFWITIPAMILFFFWASQDTTGLPGLQKDSLSFWQIVNGNIELILLSLISSVPAFYMSYYFLTPKLLFRINLLRLSAFILILTIYFIMVLLVRIKFDLMYFFFGVPVAIKTLAPIVLLSALGGTLFAFINKATDEKEENNILIMRNTKLELDLIKSSISPHFLFNTINNIDILINKDADKASLYLKKLSDILRIMLSGFREQFIPLIKEIEFISKYIDLQRVRSSNPDFVKFEYSGDLDHWQIAPMLFLPFVENAFKYSNNKLSDHIIEITIFANKENINFYCKNLYNETEIRVEKNGIGIDLIRQRLELVYKNKYKLDVSNDNQIFVVDLNISK
jgi:two-component system, LytTR family, sensor kinase